MRDFLKLYGVVLLFALPCGSIGLAGFDQDLPTILGTPASQFVLSVTALAVLSYALYLHHKR